MKAGFTWARKNALAITLILMAAAVGLCAYTLTQLQNQRIQNITRACVDQNARHTATVAQLDAELRLAEARYPKRAAEIQANRQSTILLIDTLAPYQNCQHVLATTR
jgi:uncharacterized protein HemX